MDLKEERNMILDMVAEGRINVEEAKQLLDALEKSARLAKDEDEFFSTPGVDVHIPEVRIPNVNRIINRAYRKAMPKAYSNLVDMDDMRENLEAEMERLREQMEALKEETRRIKKEPWHPEEDWED